MQEFAADLLGNTSCSPVVRTNPVTDWKSLFCAGRQVEAGWINKATERESEILKAYCELLLVNDDTSRGRRG